MCISQDEYPLPQQPRLLRAACAVLYLSQACFLSCSPQELAKKVNRADGPLNSAGCNLLRMLDVLEIQSILGTQTSIGSTLTSTHPDASTIMTVTLRVIRVIPPRIPAAPISA